MKNRLETLEQFAIDVILNRKKGAKASILRFILFLLSLVYRCIILLRLNLYRNRILLEKTLGCTVISVGNLTVGGTGKTPVVEKIARVLQDSGRNVAILSRGYKSKKPSLMNRIRSMIKGKTIYLPPRVVSDGKKVLLDSRKSGDEPYMLAKNLKNIVVVVDKDRVKSGLHAIKNFGSDTLVLDDGFQYLKLKHRLDIVLVDKYYPFGNEYMLPRGTLREPPPNIKRASFIFITKCNETPNDDLIKRIRKYNKTAEIIETEHKPLYMVNMKTKEKLDLENLRGKYIGAISAIAVPESFEKALGNLGANLVARKRFADHHRFSKKEIRNFMKKCDDFNIDYILTTEKDSVRFPSLKDVSLPVYYIRVEINILTGHESWSKFVDRICKPRPVSSPRKYF